MSIAPVPQKSNWSSANESACFIEGWLRKLHPGVTRKQRAALEALGFNQPFYRRGFLLGLTIWVLAVSFTAFLYFYVEPDEPSDFTTTIGGVAVFIFGYYQWRSSRYEKAMEDFYSRLNIANNRRENGKNVVFDLLGKPWELNGVHESCRAFAQGEEKHWIEYIYSELDNLEYVVEKYNLGYMKAQVALRGLRTFYQRCALPIFRKHALKCARSMAYNESTCTVVRKVYDDIESRRQALNPRRSQNLSLLGQEDRRKAPHPRRLEERRGLRSNKAALW